MRLEGTLEDIIFRNEENGYTVFLTDAQGADVVVVGYVPAIPMGSLLEIEGEYTDTKYGRQFNAASVKIALPATAQGIIKFLASGLIKGVGQVTAALIVARFGTKTFDVIRETPEKLAEIKGISKDKAKKIAAEYLNVFTMQETVMTLQGFDLSLNMCLRIYKVYGAKSVEVVKENPYKLVEDVDGIGFLTADTIAKKGGIAPDSVFRVRAATFYILSDSAEKAGNTYLPQEELYLKVSELLKIDISPETFYSYLEDWTIDGMLKLFATEDGARCAAFKRLYQVEKSVANGLCKLKYSASVTASDVRGEVAEFERLNAVEFHDSQIEAISSALNEGVCVITGGPGTGKTTIIRCILSVLKNRLTRVALVAPTGRAAKRMQEATGEEAKTIHRALGAEFTGGRSRFYHNERNPLPADYVIVDEVSMVDIYLMDCLLKALAAGTKLLLVGDKDQLPSVGAGNVLADILRSGLFTSNILTKIYRQAESSLIVTNAHKINRGEMPRLTESAGDFFFSGKAEQSDILATVVEMVTKRIPKYLNCDSAAVQVLAPLKAGVCGVNNLNAQLQNALNPHTAGREEIKHGETVYRAGDRVMHIVNDYELEWERNERGVITHGEGVFNGDIGVVESVFPKSGELNVLFEDGRLCAYTFDRLHELTLAYAITVHKSQGCEFPVVVMPVVRGSRMILTRNLLYTAITRAKSMVVLVGEQSSVRAMVTNDYTAVRYSRLKELIEEADNSAKLFG